MARSKLMSLALSAALAIAFAGCATDTEPGENTGSLNLNLQLADGIVINEVDWTISGGDMEPMSGTIDTSAPGATASVEVFGLPPGEGYIVELEAIDETGEVTCKGDAEFDVEVGVATDVMVFLNCKRPTRLGGVRVNGEFNICAELSKVVVSPLQTSIGNDIDLSAQTVDVEGDEVTLVWTATGGSIADSGAEQTTYTCGEVGQQSITVTVSDDDFEYCMDFWTVAVTCVAGEGDLCEGVTCEDDGNECTVESCNSGTGQCESANVDDGTECDGGAGVCMSGECAPNDLCEGVSCDDQNECTTDLCNPEDGSCSNDPVDNGTACNGEAGMCVDGTCMDVDRCEGVTCDDTGNDCTTAACNPSNGQCEVSNLPDGTECGGGGAELAVNGGFETGNLDGWTQFCDGPNNGACAATMAQAASGSWSGNLVASVPAEGGAPSFPLIKNANIGIGIVEPNSEVTISFDLFGSLEGAGGVVFAEFFSELEGGGTSSSVLLGGGPIFPTGEWVNYTYTTTTGSDVSGGVTVQLKVDCGATPGCMVDAYFDNVSVTTGSGGGAGMCSDGTCMNADLCDGVVCDDTGNECTTAACNPSNGQCEVSNVPNGTECTGGDAELAVNGGFETGNLDGWTQFCDGPNNGTCAATMAQAASGSWSGNLVASVPAEGGAPSFPLIKNANIGIGIVEPNSEVTISFDLFGSLQGAGGVVFAEFFSELEGGGTSSSVLLGGGPIFPTGEWVNYTYTTTTGSDVSGGVTVQLKVDCGATPGCMVDAYFDNVSVTTGSGGGICMDGACGVVDLCDGVICDDTGNECTTATCNPSNGACDISNVADGTICDGGAGTCSAGVCEASGGGEVYTQNFESLDQASTTALGDAGFQVFGNVFQGTTDVVIGFYGPFPAPNNPADPAFSLIASGQGGAEQGEQQLVIISDYKNQDAMTAGNVVEALTFQEFTIEAGDVGKTVTFRFQAKLGDLAGSSTAYAFIKTLAPPSYNQTNLVQLNTTSIPATWGNYSISLPIIAPLVGQILQFGFAARATNNQPSGVFYDNMVVTVE